MSCPPIFSPSTSGVSTDTNCLLFTLPNELRFKIYNEIFSNTLARRVGRPRPRLQPHSCRQKQSQQTLSLHRPPSASTESSAADDDSSDALLSFPLPSSAQTQPQNHQSFLALRLVCRAFLNDLTLYDAFFRSARFIVSRRSDLEHLCGCCGRGEVQSRTKKRRRSIVVSLSYDNEDSDSYIDDEEDTQSCQHPQHPHPSLIRNVCIRTVSPILPRQQQQNISNRSITPCGPAMATATGLRPAERQVHLYRDIKYTLPSHHELSVLLIMRFLPAAQSLTIEQSGVHINTFQHEYSFSLDDLMMTSDNDNNDNNTDDDEKKEVDGNNDASRSNESSIHSPGVLPGSPSPSPSSSSYYASIASTLSERLTATAPKMGATWFFGFLRDVLLVNHKITLEFTLDLLFERIDVWLRRRQWEQQRRQQMITARGLMGEKEEEEEIYDVINDVRVSSKDWILRIDDDDYGDKIRHTVRQHEFIQTTPTGRIGTEAWIEWLDTMASSNGGC